MLDRDRTPEAVRRRGWEVVKLRGKSKKPSGEHWETTTDAAQVDAWLTAGHNIGLVCHERTGVAVLDPDKVEWADMIDVLGQPCMPWVLTGSGNLHYYIEWTDHLPAKLTWDGKIIGEIQRGPGKQQVLLPPSIHPTTGLPYRWITESLLPKSLCEPIDPVVDPLPRLPGEWRAYLTAFTFESRYGRGR
jgi:hypothetical protein